MTTLRTRSADAFEISAFVAIFSNNSGLFITYPIVLRKSKVSKQYSYSAFKSRAVGLAESQTSSKICSIKSSYF
jgi:hypothetical protein